MTNPIHSSFTVTVEYLNKFYDVQVFPTHEGNEIDWMQGHVDNWNAAERAKQIYSTTIQALFQKANIGPALLTKENPLRLGMADGITRLDNTKIADDEDTKKICTIFIRYLRVPQQGIEELSKPSALEDQDGVAPVVNRGLGTKLIAEPNLYLNLRSDPVRQRETRLSLWGKMCCDYRGLPFIGSEVLKRLKPDLTTKYEAEELSCRAHLLGNRTDSPSPTETINAEMKAWFSHTYLLQARAKKQEEKEVHTAEQIAEIKKERDEMSLIWDEIKGEALRAQQAAASVRQAAEAAAQKAEDSDDSDDCLSDSETEAQRAVVAAAPVAVRQDEEDASDSDEEVSGTEAQRAVVAAAPAAVRQDEEDASDSDEEVSGTEAQRPIVAAAPAAVRQDAEDASDSDEEVSGTEAQRAVDAAAPAAVRQNEKDASVSDIDFVEDSESEIEGI